MALLLECSNAFRSSLLLSQIYFCRLVTKFFCCWNQCGSNNSIPYHWKIRFFFQSRRKKTFFSNNFKFSRSVVVCSLMYLLDWFTSTPSVLSFSSSASSLNCKVSNGKINARFCEKNTFFNGSLNYWYGDFILVLLNWSQTTTIAWLYIKLSDSNKKHLAF